MNSTSDENSKLNSSLHSTSEKSTSSVAETSRDLRQCWEQNSVYCELNNTTNLANSNNANLSNNSLCTAISTAEQSRLIPPLSTRTLPNVLSDDNSSELSTDGENIDNGDEYIEDEVIDQLNLSLPTVINIPEEGIFSDSDEERPESAASIVTVKATMSKPTVAMKNAVASYETAITAYDLVFDCLEISGCPHDDLLEYVNDGKNHVKRLLDAVGLFTSDPNPAVFSDEMIQKSKVYVTHYNNKIKLMYVQVKINDQTACNLRSVDHTTPIDNVRNLNSQLSTQRLARVLPSVKMSVRDVNHRFTSHRLQPVTSALELKGLENAFKQSCDMMSESSRQIDDLTKTATTANDTIALETLDGLTVSLHKQKRDTRKRLDNLYESIGIIPGMIDSCAKNIQVEAPIFAGKFSDDMDYYKFVKKISEYFSQGVVMSSDQKLLKLRNDCLLPPAKDCVLNSPSFDQAMLTLKNHFGKPTMLFYNKTQDLKSLGKCPEKLIDKRDWVFTMIQKIAALRELADDHGLTFMFESSNIVGILQKLMLKDDHDEFRKLMKEEMKAKPDVVLSKSYMLEAMVGFMQDLSSDTNCEIDYVAISSFGGYRELMEGPRESRSKDSKSSKDYKARDDKPNYSKKYNVMPLDEDSDEYRIFDELSPSDTSDEEVVDSVHIADPPTNESNAAKRSKSNKIIMNNSPNPKSIKCKLCEGSHTNLAYCKDFQSTEVVKRWRKIMKMKSCYRCLRTDCALDMDNRRGWLNSHKKFCTDKWLCKVDKCADKDDLRKNHFLICRFHIEENKPLEAEFIKQLDKSLIESDVKFFFASYQSSSNTTPEVDANINATFLADKDESTLEIEPEIKSCPIYQLQYVAGKNGEKLMVFFDSGCWSSGLSNNGYAALDTHTVKEGPTRLQVAGGVEVNVPYGEEKFWLELDSTGEGSKKRVATFTGLRMEHVSCVFPKWPLTQVYNEISQAFHQLSPGAPIPTIAHEIGNQAVDVMIGIRYNKYHPQLVYTLPSGLEIRKSPLKGFDGHQAVLAGPHPLWESVRVASNFMGPGAYLTSEFRAYRAQCDSLWNNFGPHHEESVPFRIAPKEWSLFCDCGELIDNPLIDEDRAVVSAMYAVSAGRKIKEFQLLDEIGSELGYKCIKCRACNDCKNGDSLEAISLNEEKEQFLIEQCLSYDPLEKLVKAQLPFILDPEVHLDDNEGIAKKILDSQVKLAAKDEAIKEDIIKSFMKLYEAGHIIPIKDLPENERILAEQTGYWIPWRAVFSFLSISSPTRLVYDASSRTRTGHSLNDILAKGANKLAVLLHLLIQFRFGAAAFTADIRQAYNTIKLQPEYYRYQKMLWREGLSGEGELEKLCVKTLIYGVKPSGQLTAHGFKIVADVAEEDDPELKTGSEVLRSKTYVDDLLPSFSTVEERDVAAESLVKVLDYGSMTVKSITKSGSPPDENVSSDGIHCGLVGYKWDSEQDLIGLIVKPLYLGKCKRGRLPALVEGDIAAALLPKFTKRVIAGKVAGIFDPLGIATPVTARLKLDLSDICQLLVDWDDKLPEHMLATWVHNLEQIQKLAEMKVPRSIFNHGVDINEGVILLVCTDASQSIAVATVYARMKVFSGGYVCNLVCSKSKLVTKQTVPKAELKACTMGCILGGLVKRNFGNSVTRIIFVTDSMISLFWIHCDTRPLQTGVRNQVIEIRRLCNIDDWHHIESQLNPADIATRVADADMVKAGSEWQIGKPWMIGEVESMPLKTVAEITLEHGDQQLALQEIRRSEAPGMTLMSFAHKLVVRAEFSNYIIDPLRFSWDHFIRRLAIFLKCWSRFHGNASSTFSESNKKVVVDLNQSDIKTAERYVFKRTTKELFEFNDWKMLGNLGEMKDDIFLYSGRILAGPEANFADAMIDLNRLSFAVPVLDRDSPVSLSIMKTCHEKFTHHAGSVTTLLKSREIAYIIGGKSLATEVRKKCSYCQRYKIKTLQVEMGKVDDSRYNVAPAFTICQIDLFGPYDLKCLHHQKITRNSEPVLAHGVAIKCCATNAIALYVMDGYDTANFLLAFQRHLYRYATPLEVRIDAGSQLVKAFKETKICLADIARTLNTETGSKIQFKVSPPGAHNWTGMVERSIAEVKKLLSVVFQGEYFSALQFETALGYIANELNNLPFCLGNRYTNLDSLDLLTANRLLLGRNNSRSPLGRLTIETPTKILDAMENIEKKWWHAFKQMRLDSFFPKLKKWTKTTQQPQVGQIVVFLRDLSNAFGSSIFRIGRIREVMESKDGLIRKVEIEYRLWEAKKLSTVVRSIRDIAILEVEDDLDFISELTEANAEMDHLWMIHVSTK